MKRIFTSLLVILIFITSVAASENKNSDFHYSIFPHYSFEYGTLNEFVFTNDSSDNQFKLSELNWPGRSSSFGFTADAGWKWISAEIKAAIGPGGNSGSMFDSDWQDSSDHSIKTEFSISDNTQNNFLLFEFGFKGNIPVTPKSCASVFILSYKPSIRYAYSYYSFSANNGEGWYGSSDYTGTETVSYDSPNAKHFEKGSLFGIDYLRGHQNIFIGEGVSFKFFNRLNLVLNFDISIYSLIKSIDTHYNDNKKIYGTDYFDTMHGYLDYYRFSANINYNFSKNLYIGTDYLFTNQNLIKGTTHKKSHTSSVYNLEKNAFSGSSAQTHSFTIYIKYALDDTFFIY